MHWLQIRDGNIQVTQNTIIKWITHLISWCARGICWKITSNVFIAIHRNNRGRRWTINITAPICKDIPLIRDAVNVTWVPYEYWVPLLQLGTGSVVMTPPPSGEEVNPNVKHVSLTRVKRMFWKEIVVVAFVSSFKSTNLTWSLLPALNW